MAPAVFHACYDSTDPGTTKTFVVHGWQDRPVENATAKTYGLLLVDDHVLRHLDRLCIEFRVPDGFATTATPT